MTRCSHAGQALVLALFLLVGVAAALVQGFNAGQLVHERARLTNALDAAAYSGALVQARALNFMAYTNRAMVAHQVAMAHLTTLASWAQFGDAQAGQFAASNPPVSLIAGFFGLGHGAAYAASAGLGGWSPAYSSWTAGQLARGFAEHDRVVHEVLARAQLAVQTSLAQTRTAAMQSVLALNYPAGAARLDSTPISDNLPGFVTRYGGDSRARLKGLVEQAAGRYGFLAPRDSTETSLLPVSWRCPLLRHELRRRGSTQLSGLDGWTSLDTQSYHALRSNKWIGCYYREYPMGDGAVGNAGSDVGDVEYVADPPANFADQDFWRWVQQYTQWDILGGSGNPLANSLAMAGRESWSGSGLPAFMDLGPDALGSQNPVLRFAVRAMLPREAMRTTDGVALGAAGPHAGSQVLKFDTRLAGDQMAAVSAAETFYRRPTARSDGRDEAPSLFQPYWHARLSAVTDGERDQARALQGAR